MRDNIDGAMNNETRSDMKDGKDPIPSDVMGFPRCEKCGGQTKPATLWNMGGIVKGMPDFVDVWECRDCGDIAPIKD